MKTIAYSTKRVTVWDEERDGASGKVPGKAVLYQDGYQSWCPKDVFERDYQHERSLSYGHALFALKAGRQVMRAGWYGMGKWVELRVLALAIMCVDDQVRKLQPFLMLKTINGVVPWTPSNEDQLADDWTVIDDAG